MPNEMPPEDDSYDLAEPAAAAPPPPTKLGYRTAKPSESPSADPETITSLYMPIWLLGGGVVVETIAALLRGRTNPQLAAAHVWVELIVGTLLMLVGLLIAARMRQFTLGSWGTVILRVAALSIAPAAVVTFCGPFLQHIPFGELIGLAGEFVLYFALLGTLFDLDQSDTWYCVWIIFIVHLAVYFLAMWFGGK